MEKPNSTTGMRHVALFVQDMQACEYFYVDLLDMKVEWRPDPENVYLTSGHDNLALHQAPDGYEMAGGRLDHIGFILNTAADVDDWYAWLLEHNVMIKTEPLTHRDGARSFYCCDPGGTVVQMIYHPPLSQP